MAIITLGEILDRGRDFEAAVEKYYAEIRDRSTDNGVRLLTYYFARHSRHQEQALAGMDREMLRQVRGVELKFEVPFDPNPEFQQPEFDPETIKGDRLLEAAVRHDAKLAALYRAILDQPVSDDVRAVLEALIRIEEREIVMLKKMQAMHYF